MVPGPGKRALICEDIVQLAIDNEMDWIAGRILGVGFDVNSPFGRVERGDLHRNCIRTWVDDAADCFAVPIHHNRYLIAVCWRRAPVTGPCADERMAFLSEGPSR